jgi:hypothetical protein
VGFHFGCVCSFCLPSVLRDVLPHTFREWGYIEDIMNSMLLADDLGFVILFSLSV